MKDKRTTGGRRERLPKDPNGPIHLSPEDQQAFAEALINPPPLSPALKRAFKRHRRLFGPADADD